VRGGDPQNPKLYQISAEDKDRAVYHLQNNENEPSSGFAADKAENAENFFLFETGDRHVAVNMNHVIFWQNCFDDNACDTDSPSGFNSYVNVYLAGKEAPMQFGVDEDEEADEENDEDEGQFRLLLGNLDSGLDRNSFISFNDSDGEETFMQVKDIAILEVAKDVTNPDYYADESDDESDDDKMDLLTEEKEGEE
jgi:hypothetical protein